MPSCFRVPARYYRADAEGRIHVVDRDGPIIEADSAAEAAARAEVICRSFPDFAGIGEPRLLHDRGAHRAEGPRSLTRELRPVAPSENLDEQLLRMISTIRARRRRAHG